MNTNAEIQAALAQKLLNHGHRGNDAVRVDSFCYPSGTIYMVTTASKTAGRVLSPALHPIIGHLLDLENGPRLLHPHEAAAIVESASETERG